MENIPGSQFVSCQPEHVSKLISSNASSARSLATLASKALFVFVLATGSPLQASTVQADALQAKANAPVENTERVNHSSQLDDLTNAALKAIATGDWSAALVSATSLVNEFPDYTLGHWLLAESHNVLSMSDTLLETVPNYSGALVDLLLEAQARALQTDAAPGKQVLNNLDNLVPVEMMQVGRHIDSVVLIDLESSVLYQFDTSDEQPVLEKQHYISSGEGGFGKLAEGDLKTPLGVYKINGFRSDKSLPPLYGAGALMLNYPNALDRALGRSGSGIWLHGNPRIDRSRAPRSSEGCVTMANDHLIDLYKNIDINRAHVILSHGVQWQAWSKSATQRERYRELFEQYRAAWVNNQFDDLFSLYSIDALPTHVLHAGSGTTKRVSTNSKKQLELSPTGVELDTLSRVRAADVSLLLNPGMSKTDEHHHLVMSIELPGSGNARITLYWERQASTGYWRIKRETIDAGGA